MESLQLFIGVMCLSALIGLSSAQDFKIKTITRIVLPGDGKADAKIHLLNTCYTGTFPATVIKTTLTIGLQGPTDIIEDIYYEEITGTPEPGADCKNYVGDISGYTDKIIVFIMGGQDVDGHPVADVYATAKFEIPDSFIDGTSFEAQKIVAFPAGTPYSLRFTTYPGGWKICGGTSVREPYCKDGGVTPPCYAIEVESVATYSLCTDDMYEKGGILITAPFDPSPTAQLTLSSDDVVQLSYGYTHEKEKEPTKLEITLTGIADKLEFVPYHTPEKVYGVCSTEPCELTSYDRNEDMKILIMNVDSSSSATTSNVIIFKDYNIEGTHLGQEIIEMYWKKGENYQYYAASIDDITHDSADVSVDCSKDDPTATYTYCYAYFIGLDHGTEHFVSVAPATSTADVTELKPILTNIITAEPQTTTSDDLQKKINGVLLVQGSSHADGVAQVCFEPSESNHEGTRHEAILIDEDGHWIKLYNSSQGENLLQCFSPVNLMKSSLRINKDTKLTVVIVERELSGYKVLASGQADMDLSALRAIEPEVDNGSNGSTSTLTIVGAAIAGIACIMALVAAAVMFVMKIKRDNDGLKYPLHRTNIEQDSSYIHGLDNPIPTM